MNKGLNILHQLKGDKGLWVVLMFLSIASVLTVYSSTFTKAFVSAGGNTEYYLMKHLMILIISGFAAWMAYKTPFRWFMKLAPLLLIISVFLLVGVLVFGSDINQARRWMKVPIIGMSFQPSELAKLSLILYVAAKLAEKQDTIKDFKRAFLPIILPILIVVGLIAPADLSTAALLFMTCVLMMFIGRVDWKYIALLILLAVVVLAFLIILGSIFPDLVRLDTWVTRINEFMHNSDGGYQVRQSKMAIAHGHFFGVGPGQSIQRNFLPYPYADFIYAIIVEEYGLFGAFAIIGVYFFLLWRIVKLATRSTSTFAVVLAVGLALNLVIQAFGNIAVSVQLVPVTGLTLPLVSMGGTSILIASISIGIMLSISRYVNEEYKRRKIASKASADEGHH